MYYWIVIAAAASLAGCATQKSVYLPDGTQGYLIECSGTAFNWGHCETKAGETCKTLGYTEISRSEDQGTTIAGSQYGTFAGTVHSRSMMIRCN